MELRRLGRTNWQVGAIGFGGIPIQRNSFSGAADIIRRAIELGTNFFDTARGYEDSEEKIGAAIQGIVREKIFLATKSRARDKTSMAIEIRASLEKMKTDYIDLYQCHNIMTEDDFIKVFSSDGALAALRVAKEQGVIRAIGVSSHNPQILLKCMETGVFDTVQFPFNYIEQDQAEEILKLAEAHQMGTIIMKPMAGGALTNGSAALKFILSHQVSVVIPGMDSVEQVETNCSIANGSYSLTEEEASYLAGEREALGKNFCRRCGYCNPCSVGIDIPTVFILDGYYKRYSLPQWSQERYQTLGVKADACTECGICEDRCPYSLPIRQMLQDANSRLNK